MSPSDVGRSWLRLQTPVDCIPHPYHMNVKCFSTLIYCRWAHGCTLTLLHLCRRGWIFAKIGDIAEFEWWWRQNRRNRASRGGFLHYAMLSIDRRWWSPSSYDRRGGPLLAFKHTTISQHTMQQVSIVKLPSRPGDKRQLIYKDGTG